MKKNLLFLIPVVCVCLAACNTDEEEIVENESVAVSEEVSEEVSENTEETESETTKEDVDDLGNIYVADENEKDKNKNVSIAELHPKWDKYEAPEAKKENKYKRLREGFIDGYEPGTAVGGIVPYTSFEKTVYAYEYDTYTTYHYGFVDSTGTIVSDDVYRYVYDYDDYYRVGSINEEKSYVLTKDGKLRFNVEKGFNDLIKTALAFYILRVGDFSYSGTRYNQQFFVDKYDLDGNLIETKTVSIDDNDVFETSFYMYESQNADAGLQIRDMKMYDERYLIITVSKVTTQEYYAEYSYVFDMDTGNKEFETPSLVRRYSNGTYVTEDYDNVKLLNNHGKQISGESFYRIEYLKPDLYVVKDTDESFPKIVTISGNGFKTVTGLFKRDYKICDKCIAAYGYTMENYDYYDFDGNKISEPENDHKLISLKNSNGPSSSVLKDIATGKEYVFVKDYDGDDGNIKLIDPDTNQVVFEQDYRGTYFYSVYIVNGVFFCENTGIDINTGETIFNYIALVWGKS